MGLLNKIKTLLFEEEEIEVKDESSVDEEDGSKEEPGETLKTNKKIQEKDEMEDIISERELFQSETTFKFPVIFEDEDFIAEKKNNKNPNALDYESSKTKDKPKKEEKRKFKASPVISPVYGVLDKNYKKEEKLEKEKELKKEDEKKHTINFDVVRQKAYGSLSDDLEKVLNEEDNKGMFFNLKSEERETTIDENNLLYDMSEKDEDLTVKELAIEDIEEDFIEPSKEKPSAKDQVKINSSDNLFDLIDSMYENDGSDL